ncbi:MAG TPA: hypothetical protein VM716_07690 [Gemmatimonadales bacterium]|nr:hypothetical protein [Gemmatimonadales bacterium]
MSAHRGTWCALAAAALIASACKEANAPQLSSPQQLTTNLTTVSSVFAAQAYQSFTALDSAPGSPAATTTPAGALLSAARVGAPLTPRQPYADAPTRLQAFRTAASTIRSGLLAQVIPSTVWGKTYVWNTTTHQYAEDPSPAVAAPSTGVRIILYAIDPITDHIVESPLTPVGYLDLIDKSSGNTNQLEVIVKDGTPPNGTTYVDYTVTATVTGSPASAFDASALGFVTDGTRRVDFTATFSATNLTTTSPSAHAVVHWALDNPALTIDMDERLDSQNANQATITIDFTYQYNGESVRLTGTVTVVQSPQSVTADLAVYENGGGTPVALIRGTADATHDGITITDNNGHALSPDQLQALAKLFEVPDQLEAELEHFFHPCEHFMGA